MKNRLKDLRKSTRAVGQLYPVLRDSSGKVIDGFHRLDVDPDWKSITLENVENEEGRLIVSVHANILRRGISRKEKMKKINDLAEIYYKQGLRPDAKVKRTSKRSGKEFEQTRIENQIKHKIVEVLDGCLNPSQVKNLLLPKYLYQAISEGNKKAVKRRHVTTSAYELIISSLGRQLKNVYSDDIFGRLEREMIDKAKNELRNNRWFIDMVKDEIRDEVEA